VSIRAICSCDKQKQATTTLPIVMDAIKAITNRDGRDQHLHREVQKCSQTKPLKCNEEGHGNQSQSHKAALLTNAAKAL
jgi:hypothetical protein